MSKRTVTNDNYHGIVESLSIPAEVVERDGKKFAKFGDAVPIHCCNADEVALHAASTHHYCDIFTNIELTPPEELLYVRLDQTSAEKVFINRAARLLVVSAEGRVAQWRAAPTFESANRFVAGTPVVTRAGQLVALLTARRGNHYAVSNVDGEGGYFDTPRAWTYLDIPEGALIYGKRAFASRDELRAFVETLPEGVSGPLTPVLWRGSNPRITLTMDNGRQVSHHYLSGVITSGNLSVVQTADYQPEASRFRRPRHVLVDPDDDITVALSHIPPPPPRPFRPPTLLYTPHRPRRRGRASPTYTRPSATLPSALPGSLPPTHHPQLASQAEVEPLEAPLGR